MKKKIWNATHISGRLYQHTLKLKESGPNSKNPGTPFISGEIEIATDDAGLNIVPVHFTYVTATTSQGKPNATFKVLNDVINGVYKSIIENGKESATLFTIDSAIGLNEFYSDRNGTDDLVSVKRNEGGFVRTTNEVETDEKLRSTFDTDILIYNVATREADEERELPERAVVSGYIMDFRQAFLPVEYTVLAPGAIAYFESLDASKSNPVFTHVKGIQKNQTVVRRVEEEGAFGEPSVREFTNTRKDFIITWAAKETYTIGDEGSDITAEEIKKGLADREVTKATIKKNQEEWQAAKNNANSAFAAPTGDEKFDF